MAKTYGAKPSSWLLPPSQSNTPEGMALAMDLDQAVLVVGSAAEQRDADRIRRNAETARQNRARRREMGLVG